MDEKLLQRAEEFHGHMCGGLTIGLRTALLAQKLFSEVSFRNAEVIVTSKTGACPKDGLMVVLGVRPDNRTLEIDPNLDCDYKLYDIIESEEPDALSCITVKQDIQVLYSKLESELTPRERLILKMRYGLYNEEECTQREIARRLGISRSYVSRIEKRALTKILKEFIKNEK